MNNKFSKLIVYLVIVLFILVCIFPIISSNISSYDRLDQKQTLGRAGHIFYPDYKPGLAQSFKPTLDNLSRVQIKLCKDYEIVTFPIEGIVHLSIRNSFNGDNLASKSITDEEIISDSLPEWVEFDFLDIDVIPEETYYIVCIWEGSEIGPKLGVSLTNNYSRGELWYQNIEGGLWKQNNEQDFAFKTYGYNSSDPKPIADLECTGSLKWSNIKPKVIISGDFTVKNIGYSESKLDWEIVDNPVWGEWTFTPSEGYDLTVFDSEFTVDVLVVAPAENNQNFTGEIKIANKENASDYEILDVSLSTPKNKPINNLFITFLDNHPYLFPLLQQKLGLK